MDYAAVQNSIQSLHCDHSVLCNPHQADKISACPVYVIQGSCICALEQDS